MCGPWVWPGVAFVRVSISCSFPAKFLGEISKGSALTGVAVSISLTCSDSVPFCCVFCSKSSRIVVLVRSQGTTGRFSIDRVPCKKSTMNPPLSSIDVSVSSIVSVAGERMDRLERCSVGFAYLVRRLDIETCLKGRGAAECLILNRQGLHLLQ